MGLKIFWSMMAFKIYIFEKRFLIISSFFLIILHPTYNCGKKVALEQQLHSAREQNTSDQLFMCIYMYMIMNLNM
jgi:hypothetical protein